MKKIDYFDYYNKATDFLEKYNDRLNQWSDRFSVEKALPAIKSAYAWAEGYVPPLLGRIDPAWQKWAEQNWYDPFSTSFILKITQVVEQVSLWIATHKPHPDSRDLPGYPTYLETCLISGAQHLHKNIKEINFLLKLPSTLRYYTEMPSFDRFINKLPNFFGRSWVVVSKFLIALKYITLKVLEFVLLVIEVVLGFFGLDSLYYLIEYLRAVIHAAAQSVFSKFTEVAHNKINERENKIRKELTESIANTVTDTVVTTVNRVAIKSLIGGAAFFGAKFILQSCFNIPSQPLYDIGLGILGAVIWKKVLRPTWDPYFKAYDQDYDPNQSYLKEFCQKHKISQFFPSLKMIQTYAKDDPA